jgi:hypothetical protein
MHFIGLTSKIETVFEDHFILVLDYVLWSSMDGGFHLDIVGYGLCLLILSLLLVLPL